MLKYANNMIQLYFMQGLPKRWEIKLDKGLIIIKNIDRCIVILVLKNERNFLNKLKERLENFFCIHFCFYLLCLLLPEKIIDFL